MKRSAIYLTIALLVPVFLAGCEENSSGSGQTTEKSASEHPGEVAKQHESEAHEEAGGSSVVLTPAQIELAQINTSTVKRGEVRVPLDLTGEVMLNRQRLAYIVPRVPGYVTKIERPIGSAVRANDTLAIIESRELVEMKNAYLGAREKAPLALSRMQREEQLWKRKISSEQDYQDARQVFSEAGVQLRTAEQSLVAVGIDPKSVALDGSGRYGVVTPIDGTVIDWNIAQGQMVGAETAVFTVADLSRLWVMATVNIKDIGRIQHGQQAFVQTRQGGTALTGTVDWVGDTVDERTRTQQVRIEIENAGGRLKPGMFVTATVFAEVKPGVLVVPVESVQRQKDEAIVFVAAGEGRFERREVKIGLRDPQMAEITMGLSEGDLVVTRGGFTLKSELEKSGFGGDSH